MSASQSRWSRVLVAAGVVFLVAWQVTTLAGLGRRTAVSLGLYGFVLHVVFGKAYALVPSYFDRDLAWPRAPAVQAPLTGLGAVALGLSFAFGSRTGPLVVAHYRLNLLGFLGLTVVGVTYQFYPPTVGRFPWAGDRLALATIAGIAAGLAIEVAVASVGGSSGLDGLPATVGRGIALVGALGYAYLVLGVFVQRARQ